MKELKGLTGLRFLAAFYVFAAHIHFRFPLPLPAPVHTVVSLGALGVNVFFVLSGFILTYAHLKDYSTPVLPSRSYFTRFQLKRFARIYPAYLIGFLACLAVSCYLQDYPQPFELIAALDATMLQSYVPALAMQWYGGGAWSVSTEFFFYLLFPFLLPLLLRIPSKAMLPLLVVTIVASSVPGFYYATHPGAISLQATYAFPPSRLPEFVCGVLLGLLVLRHKFRVSEVAAVAAVAIAALYLAKFGARLPGFTAHNIVVVPVILVLLSALVHIEQTHFIRWIGSRPMQYLGRISFSFYIMQLPLLMLVDGLLAKEIIHHTDTFLVLPTLIVNLLLAAALYEGVEKRAHRYLLGRFF